MPACTTCGGVIPADARYCSSCGALVASHMSAAARKTVTILFSDMVDFTGFTGRHDPELLHAVMARYFAPMRVVVDRHGGWVTKFIGDAILVVFGAPKLHEDDAIRAARCALEMREALSRLNPELRSGWGVTLRVRYGIATGEVAFARVGDNPFFPLGESVNLAQRLETAAPADGVLVCPRTARFLRSAAQLRPVEPIKLKGIPAPVAASRLLSLRPSRDAIVGPPASRIVGRGRELGILHAALEDVIAHRRCRTVFVVGPAGVGKSSLVCRFVADVEASAVAVTGHCLSYGEGIMLSPLVEVVEQLAGSSDEGAITALVGDDEEGRWVAGRVARAVGSASGAATLEEIQLAVRRVLEAAASRRPLILVVEDIHWAQPTLLDVLDYVAVHAQGVPVLLVCLARPDLLERQPTAPLADRVVLRPLSDAESADLLERLDPVAALSAVERERVLAAAEGNPLFLEQMVAMKQETGTAGAIPGSIQALLAARVDRLPEVERAVIDCAAVEGRDFHHEVVAELLSPPLRDTLDEALASLVQRDLIRPGQAKLPDDMGYRFSHILVRDAAYALLPKTRRGELHERFARWLGARPVGERELREIIGLHFEQAYRCAVELHPVKGADERQLGRAGADHLGDVGRAALARGDLPAAANLLERAIAMLDDDEPSLGWLLPELGTALTEAGRLTEAGDVLAAAVPRAHARGERAHQAHARVCLLFVRMQLDTGPAAREILRRFADLQATFAADGDALGLDRLWRLRALVHWVEARSGDADTAWQMAVEHAERAGDAHGRADALSWLASSALAGPTPANEGIARCEALRRDLRGNRREEASVLQPLAALWAMRGEFAIASELLEQSNAMLAELGESMDTAVQYHEAFVALLAGDPAGAEARLRAGYERLHEMGEKALRADAAALLARAVHGQGRLDEALELTRTAEADADEYDLSPRFSWRAVRALTLVARGELDEAMRLTDEALALVRRTDWLSDHADVLVAHAEVLTACGEHAASEAALQAALELYDRKGNVVAADRVRKQSHVRARA